MEKLGIDLLDPNLFNIEGLVDASRIVTGLELPFSENLPSPRTILDLLRVSFHKSYLHNAGNDAQFTLRALLMLTAMALEKWRWVNCKRTEFLTHGALLRNLSILRGWHLKN